ncbi:MAG: chemotaxis protein methyltransferase CheR/two-component system CheB/CheR fusion protein [Candidatus Azotimanducaceae bacterium]|jgi:chemotaxis protein methyltransferase CheR/two-component system CheB/CheR fusion protein
MKKTSKPQPQIALKDASADLSRGRASENPVIVGIGTSAGGLGALEEFFVHLPVSPNIAFVIVQHLDPTHKSIMPELLQRSTLMKVTEASNRMKVKPNNVYVIPPNRDLSMLHG